MHYTTQKKAYGRREPPPDLTTAEKEAKTHQLAIDGFASDPQATLLVFDVAVSEGLSVCGEASKCFWGDFR